MAGDVTQAMRDLVQAKFNISSPEVEKDIKEGKVEAPQVESATQTFLQGVLNDEEKQSVGLDTDGVTDRGALVKKLLEKTETKPMTEAQENEARKRVSKITGSSKLLDDLLESM